MGRCLKTAWLAPSLGRTSTREGPCSDVGSPRLQSHPGGRTMVWRRITFLAAASVAALGLCPGAARAEFTYVTSVSPNGASGIGSYLTMAGQADPTPEALPTDIKVADVYATDL